MGQTTTGWGKGQFRRTCVGLNLRQDVGTRAALAECADIKTDLISHREWLLDEDEVKYRRRVYFQRW